MTTRQKAIPALTGLRFVAALAVYFSHLGMPINWPLSIRTGASAGYVGVTFFFVLSGFVLSHNYFDDMRRPTPRKLWSFFLTRFARIYPLYLLILGYCMLRDHSLGGTWDGAAEHMFAVQAWLGDLNTAYRFNGPGWSISVEFFLYACFPLVALMFSRLKRTASICASMAVTLIAMFILMRWFVDNGKDVGDWLNTGSAHRWLYRSPLPRLGDFVLGTLLARLVMDLPRTALVGRAGAWLAAAAAAVVLWLMTKPSWLFRAWSWDVGYVVPFLAIVGGLAVADRGAMTWMLSRRPVLLLGEASFAFYLIHVRVVTALSGGGAMWAAGFSWGQLGLQSVTLVLTIAFAIGLHRAIERPARLKVLGVLRTGRSALPNLRDAPGDTRRSGFGSGLRAPND